MSEPKKSARGIIRDMSAEQSWTPETEICVLCDFLDWVQDGGDNPDSCFMLDELETYLRRRADQNEDDSIEPFPSGFVLKDLP